MHWPQVVMIVLLSVGIFADLAIISTSKTAGRDIVNCAISRGLYLWLLIAGGYFA